MSDGAFHSPYQFIPVKRRPGATFDPESGEPDFSVGDTDVGRRLFSDIAAGKTAATHDRYIRGLHSGRILCSLTVQSPLLVGAERKPAGDGDEGIGTMANYCRGNEPAVPGNSLRGAVGSLMEILSQSAMRVLADQTYDVRKSMGRSLKAIGLVTRRSDGKWWLQPLALTGIMVGDERFADKWLRVFSENLKLGDCLTTYFGNYKGKDGWASPKGCECFQLRDHEEYRSIDGEPSELYQATLGKALRQDPKPISGFKPRGNLRYRTATPQVPPLLGQGREDASRRGVLYVLGGSPELPRKYHEWFVPFRVDRVDHNGRPFAPELPADDAVENFEYLAARSQSGRDQRRLFIPQGYGNRQARREPTEKGAPGVLHSGDLVYFDVDDPGEGGQDPKVTEISWSAIWRKWVEGTLYEAFAPNYNSNDETADDGELLPWGVGKRRHLTAAEVALGVVEDGGRPGHNLASRIRFADALPHGKVTLQVRVPLRPLSSPKPPAPSMYFRDSSGAFIPKEDLILSGAERHTPNGRKLYLHHRSGDWKSAPQWRTSNLQGHADIAHQKEPRSVADYTKLGGLWGTPIEPGGLFLFHVDFQNLTDAELHLLRAALDPAACLLNPGYDQVFQHKLGWGKPLGLGSVQLSRVAELYVDRTVRYRPDTLLDKDPPRYAEVWLGDDTLARDLPDRYAVELACINQARKIEPKGAGATNFVDAKALATLLAIGNPGNVQYPVTYPVSAAKGQKPGDEDEGFAWFVANERAGEANSGNDCAEMLGSVQPSAEDPLPELHDHHFALTRTLADANATNREISNSQEREIIGLWRDAYPNEQPPRLTIRVLRNRRIGNLVLIDVKPICTAEKLLNLNATPAIRLRRPEEARAYAQYKEQQQARRAR